MMKQSFFVPGTLPGLNEIIAAAKVRRGPWNQYSDMKRKLTQEILVVIFKAKLQPMDSCFVTFTWGTPNRKRDLDNIACGKKFVLDALVKANIIGNDNWRYLHGFKDLFKVDKHFPGVLVQLDGE